jgi:DNA-binding NarL/FixJ family response regulator
MDAPERLTPRQWEVAQLLTKGRTNRQIGADLRIAESTVKAHIAAIFVKWQVDNRTAAALYFAARFGCV